MESLIYRSGIEKNRPDFNEELHKSLVARYYNAENVAFDYHRKRVWMDVTQGGPGMEDNPGNVQESILRINLRYDDLAEFLKSCLSRDSESLAFYIRILRSYPQNELPLIAV